MRDWLKFLKDHEEINARRTIKEKLEFIRGYSTGEKIAVAFAFRFWDVEEIPYGDDPYFAWMRLDKELQDAIERYRKEKNWW